MSVRSMKWKCPLCGEKFKYLQVDTSFEKYTKDSLAHHLYKKHEMELLVK